MGEPRRIDPVDARVACVSGLHEARLVCAYADEDRCREFLLDGAVTLAEFEREMPALPKGQPIVFYCACPHDETAVRVAAAYLDRGFAHASVLDGGVKAWIAKGYPAKAGAGLAAEGA